MKRLALAVFALICLTASAQSQSSSGNAIPVTVDNFRRAETDMYFALFASQGGFGRFEMLRDLPLENTPACGRTAIRSIR